MREEPAQDEAGVATMQTATQEGPAQVDAMHQAPEPQADVRELEPPLADASPLSGETSQGPAQQRISAATTSKLNGGARARDDQEHGEDHGRVVEPAVAGQSARRSPAVAGMVIGVVAFALVAVVAAALIFVAHPFSQASSTAPLVSTVSNPANGSGLNPVVTACSTSSTCLTPAVPAAGNVNLTFSGAVAGQMAITTLVSCGVGPSVAGGQQYHLSVLGTLKGRQYGFAFSIYPYTYPNTYTGAVSSFFGPAGANSSLAQWRSHAPTGASVTVNSEALSGTLAISLTGASDHSTVHVVGSWTCT